MRVMRSSRTSGPAACILSSSFESASLSTAPSTVVGRHGLECRTGHVLRSLEPAAGAAAGAGEGLRLSTCMEARFARSGTAVYDAFQLERLEGRCIELVK